VSSTAGRGTGATARSRLADGRAEGALTAGEVQRAKILAAISAIIASEGAERANVSRIVRRAGVQRGAFYEQFSGRDDALLALVEHAIGRTTAAVRDATEEEAGWLGTTRAGLIAMLELFESEPNLGRLCLVHSRHPHPSMRRLRRATLALLAQHVSRAGRGGRERSRAIAAEGIVAGVAGILESRLEERRAPRLTELAGELMAFIVLPYRGARAAQAERTSMRAHRWRRSDTNGVSPAPRTSLRMTYRTMRVLATIRDRPGLSNLDVAEQAGIADQGQISKLLKRLHEIGLIENTGGGQELGAANAWRLTDEGRRVERSILEHVPWRHRGR
jgi:AcrR family transcriptional regulator